MRFDIFSLFPEMFDTYLNISILKRAQETGALEVHAHNIRDWAVDKHHTTDDTPYGGGGGMVMKPEPVFAAVEAVLGNPPSCPLILLCPQGRLFNQEIAFDLVQYDRIALLCGRYESVDERIRVHLATDSLSIGDYVLTGGEIPALIIIDAVTRLIPGVLGDPEGALDDSHANGLLEYPHYTRPPEFRGWGIPDVLLSGNHAEIDRWRRQESLRRTLHHRPDLLEKAALSQDDLAFLKELGYQPVKKTTHPHRPNGESMETKKMNYLKTFLLGFGFFGVSVIWSVYNAFVPLILDERFGLQAGFISFIMVLDNIAALIIQPPLGVFSDRLRSPIGRRLPFIVVGAPLAAAMFGLIPYAHVLPLFIFSCITLLLAMAFWRTPVVALMPDITPSGQRSPANGVINLMGGLGTVLATLIGGPLYNINPAYPFFLAAGLVLLAAILVLIFIREPKEYISARLHLADRKEGSQMDNKVLKNISNVFTQKDKSPMYILLAILFWFIAYNSLDTFFTLFGVNHLGLTGGDSAFQISYIGLSFMLMAIPAGILARRFKRKNVIIVGIWVMVACVILMYLIPSGLLTMQFASLMGSGFYVLSIILIVAGLGWAMINVNSLPMVVDMTDDEHIGTYTGLYYFFSQLAATVGPVFFGWTIQLAGNDYRLMMVIAPFFLILAFVMMISVKRGEIKSEPGDA